MATPTLDPVEIVQLHFLTLKQAQIYCAMDAAAFRSFCLRRNVPYQCESPEYPKAKRRYARGLLEKAMLDDMTHAHGAPALTESASKRVQQIVGEER